MSKEISISNETVRKIEKALMQGYDVTIQKTRDGYRVISQKVSVIVNEKQDIDS